MMTNRERRCNNIRTLRPAQSERPKDVVGSGNGRGQKMVWSTSRQGVETDRSQGEPVVVVRVSQPRIGGQDVGCV